MSFSEAKQFSGNDNDFATGGNTTVLFWWSGLKGFFTVRPSKTTAKLRQTYGKTAEKGQEKNRVTRWPPRHNPKKFSISNRQ